ncbi:MAG: VCBS repeat-containing protein [Cyclobacteriaceae bacterium]
MSKFLYISFVLCCAITSVTAQVFFEKKVRGLDNLNSNNGVSVADFNGDGHLDVYVVANRPYDPNNPETWSRLFQNNNDGSFKDVTEASGLIGSYTDDLVIPTLPFLFRGNHRHGASWGDFDNDGDPDLFLNNYYHNQLFENNGDGTFTNITKQVNLASTGCYATSAAWIDINNDQYLDLIISSWAECNNQLFINNGDGSFTEKSEKLLPAAEELNSWMCLPVDVNNDRFVDLLFINDFTHNTLLVNDGTGNFADQSSAFGFTAEGNHMGATYADANNDGLLDIYVSDIDNSKLWVNNGETFDEQAAYHSIDSTGWSWQTKFADMDLDGDQDLLVTNGYVGYHQDHFFENQLETGSFSFVDNTVAEGFDRYTNSYAFELFDYDHDGDLDVFNTSWRDDPTFYENNTISNQSSTNVNWVKVELNGTTSNRSAIGTHIILVDNHDLKQVAFYTGVGFMSQSLQPVHFGTGLASEIKELILHWPSGEVDSLFDLPVNKTISVVEGNGYELKSLQSNKISGCTDPNSCSYNPLATSDDGSCTYLVPSEISGPEQSGMYAVATYTYPNQSDHTYEWHVEDGSILSGQGTNEITVQWGISADGKVSVQEKGDCFGEIVIKEVTFEGGLRNQDYSIARLWNEVLLEAIRKDYARPTVHARNLFHTSAVIYDLWALYNQSGKTFLTEENYAELLEVLEEKSDEEKKTGLEQAISHAMFKVMKSRFDDSPGHVSTKWLMLQLMTQLGLDPGVTSTDYSLGDNAAIGNYVAELMINYGYTDGAREVQGYSNNYYETTNTPLAPSYSGNPLCEDPNRWQPLQLVEFIDQSGNLINASTPEFLSPEWGNVRPFALSEENMTRFSRDGDSYQVYHDPGLPPMIDTISASDTDEFYKWGFSLVSIWGAHLDPTDGVMWDISPASIGNIDLSQMPENWSNYNGFYNHLEGGDIGQGHDINPITNEPYATQMVPRGDYARVLAEFWADGPDSETPPGHWFTLLNYVSDHPEFERKFAGKEVVDNLEWDVKSYFTLGGAMHDAAISAWGIKGWYDYIRPISAIRYMADRGQSTDPSDLNYNQAGIPLVDGYIALVKEGDVLAGSDGRNIGKIKVKSWRGHDYIQNAETDEAGVGWILAENWWPYQRPSFVTPPFAGYVSGHSTFSRAAAEVMTLITGSAYFPGGMGEFVAIKDEFLVFEKGPSTNVVLQWATYRDASDQCSLSRIWGGIHPPADDIPGRLIGEKVGIDAFNMATKYFDGRLLSTREESTMPGSIYPNPSRPGDLITLTTSSPKTGDPVLIDLQGKRHNILLKDHDENGKKMVLQSNSELSPGIYILKYGQMSYKLIIGE